ncbi:MAG: pyridoxamine 5'-phosphate oxidase [Verrucomicrobia bacterium]|nr:MAG: pyridoxamine 5'-phosphate oxidase [Verrucomicrobiota bacterium]
MEKRDLLNERREYRLRNLTKADLLADPIAQFQRWLDDAFASGMAEPTAMCLATASSHGKPLVRTVLLKSVDQRGFTFFTNLESRKADQLKENDAVSLLFPWLLLERQVVVVGKAIPLPREESEAYFSSRPHESQLSAWASPQSRVIPSREFLEQEWQSAQKKFGKEKIPLPPFWGGICVVPETIEFWQGGARRLHDRLQYRKDSQNHWMTERLAP